MNRRAFIGGGAGALLGLGAVIYAPLGLGDGFEAFVADKLGVDVEMATKLLERVKADRSGLDYDARAAAFSLALRNPLSALVPEGRKRAAVESLVGRMFDTPSARLVYSEGAGDPGLSACLGLRRPA